MGKLDRVGLLTYVLALGCSAPSARDAAPSDRTGALAARKGSTDGAAAADPRFDATGKLKPGGQRLSWVEIPSGFVQQPGSTPQSATFEAREMPLAKATDFFEERLLAGAIQLRPNGVSYRNSKAKHTQLPLPPVNVTVLEIDRAQQLVRVVVDDLAPPSEPPLRVDLAARELARERKSIE